MLIFAYILALLSGVHAQCGDTMLWKASKASDNCANPTEEFNFGNEWSGSGINSQSSFISALYVHNDSPSSRYTKFFSGYNFGGEVVVFEANQVGNGGCVYLNSWGASHTWWSLVGPKGIAKRDVVQTIVDRATANYSSGYKRGDRPRFLIAYDNSTGEWYRDDYDAAVKPAAIQKRAASIDGNTYYAPNGDIIRPSLYGHGYDSDHYVFGSSSVNDGARAACQRWNDAEYGDTTPLKGSTSGRPRVDFTLYPTAAATGVSLPGTVIYSMSYEAIDWARANSKSWCSFNMVTTSGEVLMTVVFSTRDSGGL